MSRGWLVALMIGAAAASACSKGPSEDDCKALLDHLVDLEFKKSGVGPGMNKDDLAKKKADVIDAKLTAGFVDQCTKTTPKSRVECAMNASDLDTGVAKCDEGK